MNYLVGSASFEFKRQYSSEGEIESFEDIIDQDFYADSDDGRPCVNQMQYGIDIATEITTESNNKWQRLENNFFWRYFARFFFGYW